MTACLEFQARSCAHIGSPLYATLFAGLATDHAAGGITATLLDGVSEQPAHDAVALRYVAAVHALALRGEAPHLAERYPSCGGSWDGSDITADFLGVVHSHRSAVEHGVRHRVQTNEVGRAVVVHSAMQWLAAHTQRPLRTVEVGASAGLLSHWMHFHYDSGESTWGDPNSALRFDASWYRRPPTRFHDLEVVERRASDVAPIDLTTEDGRVRMLSFLWPDQTGRITRLRAATDVALRHPLSVERGDAGEWVAAVLGGPAPQGVTTVITHTIVWQYLPAPTRAALRAALADAAGRATPDAPLAWLRMEPATAEHADVRATVWPGGQEHHLADVGYHGAGVEWLAD